MQDTQTAAQKIASEIKATPAQVDAAIRLLDEGATVPFIARYRKEVTGSLSDSQLRHLEDRLYYLRELDERRVVIRQSLREQKKLTLELDELIQAAETKIRLEDLYLPYRPKRRTKAQLAREAGLEQLAHDLLQKPSLAPEEQARAFINEEHNIQTWEMALEGARQILMEQFVEDPELVAELREYFWQHGLLKSVNAGKSKKETAHKFADYFNYSEPFIKIPSHRALALFRGRRDNVLQLSVVLEGEIGYPEQRIVSHFKLRTDTSLPGAQFLLETVRMAWKTKLSAKLELELLTRLRELADEEAIKVFAKNLRDLLLAAPAGQQVTLGLDPGIRTGVKATVVDDTGKFLDYTVVFPFAPQNEWHQSITELAKLVAKYHVKLVSIGNGTGSRDTERLVADLMKMYPDLLLTKVVVNEAGASVYSASELAALEFPDLDVSLRGAVSIARRLQDPLAELVKITPKSIGVGQYQHDVNQARLDKILKDVVEDCVNYVGVDLNTASVSLLSMVSGLNEALAKNIVDYRNNNGAFNNRQQLFHVPRMGEKTFQQAAGFLRIRGGEEPLDASAVHPEAYPVVNKMLTMHKLDIHQVMGNATLIKTIHAENFVDETIGLPTLRDVLNELEKPGRDPRPEFKTINFKEGVEEIGHLEPGMILEGIISNVTNFGAFVDIGVHQDGLVHISAMTDRFITDPHQIVKAGDIVTVKVVEVDKERRRIGLSMKLQENQKTVPAAKKPIKAKTMPEKQLKIDAKKIAKEKGPQKNLFNTAIADAFAKLKGGLNDQESSR